MDTSPDKLLPRKIIRTRGILIAIAICAALYVLLAYAVLPKLWAHYEHQPGLHGRPMVTVTAQGIPGDPINIGLVGDRAEVVKAWRAAGWNPADPITLKTSIEIAGSVILHRAYSDAPVSSLFYDGRRQDLAFEKLVGGSADRRHHVRLWLTLEKGIEGRRVWLGAATFDRGVGVSHYTGQITHHIAPDIDAERDSAVADLTRAGMLAQVYQVSGVGPTINGRNGGGDRYFTDGEIVVGVLRPDAIGIDSAPETLPSPARIRLTTSMWSALRGLLGGRAP